MGRSSKPLTIRVDPQIYGALRDKFIEMEAQGHTIIIAHDEVPDIYLAPYAFRVTTDMVEQIPKQSLDLAIAGARALRYGPLAKDTGSWKASKGKKNAQVKKARNRKNAKVKVEASVGGESSVNNDGTTITRTTSNEGQPSTVTNVGADGAVNSE